MKFRKILAAALSAVMTAAALAAPASAAEKFDKAVKKKLDTSFSVKLERSKEYDYKVTLTEGGDLKISFSAEANDFEISAYDSKGGIIKPSSFKFTAGKGERDDDSLECEADKQKKLSQGTVTYSALKKATYYIRVKGSSDKKDFYGDAKMTMKFTVSPSGGSSGKSSSANGFLLQIIIKKGDIVKLAAIVDGGGDAEWSSSNKAAVTVSSSGKIKGVGIGTAVITAKNGAKIAKIQVKVI